MIYYFIFTNIFKQKFHFYFFFFLQTQGSWKAAIKLSDILSETAKFPHDKMKFKCCKIVAQTKMRQYKAAHDELETIGSFSDPKNCFEAYPEFYNNLRGLKNLIIIIIFIIIFLQMFVFFLKKKQEVLYLSHYWF